MLNAAATINIVGVQQAGVVSAVQLLDVRLQFPVGLVCRQFLIRALLDDPVSAEASHTVSTTSSVDDGAQHHRSGTAAVQLRSVDVRRQAAFSVPRTTASHLSGASATHTIPTPAYYLV